MGVEVEVQCIFLAPYANIVSRVASQEPNAGGEIRLQCHVCRYWIRDYELLKKEIRDGRSFFHCPNRVEAQEVLDGT